jgi:hypothetical protein
MKPLVSGEPGRYGPVRVAEFTFKGTLNSVSLNRALAETVQFLFERLPKIYEIYVEGWVDDPRFSELRYDPERRLIVHYSCKLPVKLIEVKPAEEIVPASAY